MTTMANNVVIKKRVAAYNVDAYNRTAVCDVDVENGCVFKLSAYSTNAGESKVWQAEQATETDKGLWMATSPEVVTIKDAMGVEYRGLTKDPRAFVNVAGRMIDVTKLIPGDIIEMTGANIENIESLDYLVPDASGYKLKASASEGTGMCLHKIGTSILHIGDAALVKSHPTTYKFEVVNN